jgi:quinol monooxygenase YgiN
MPVVVQLRLIAREGKGSDLAAFLAAMLPGTRQAEGCLGLASTRDQRNDLDYTILQSWRSREDYLAYSRWRRDRGDLEPFGQLLAAPPELRFLDLVATY